MSRTYRHPNYLTGTTRDGKSFHKPDSFFKKTKRRSRKAKEKQALIRGEDPPKFRKTDEWDWN